MEFILRENRNFVPVILIESTGELRRRPTSTIYPSQLTHYGTDIIRVWELEPAENLKRKFYQTARELGEKVGADFALIPENPETRHIAGTHSFQIQEAITYYLKR